MIIKLDLEWVEAFDLAAYLNAAPNRPNIPKKDAEIFRKAANQLKDALRGEAS